MVEIDRIHESLHREANGSVVVDDHAEIRHSVTRYLEKNGLRATGAKSAGEMDAQLAEHSFDLIVLDTGRVRAAGPVSDVLAAQGCPDVLSAFRKIAGMSGTNTIARKPRAAATQAVEDPALPVLAVVTIFAPRSRVLTTATALARSL